MVIDLFRCTMTPEAAIAAAKIYTPDENGRCYVGEGNLTAEFERIFSERTGLDTQILGTNSCTASIDLALHLIGLEEGDEVITTPMTCSATNGPVVNRGGKLVWADVDPFTGLIDPDSVGRVLSSRTRAIIAVDWAGRKCDFESIRVNSNFAVPIIEDAAHCIFLDDERGDYVAYSFGPIKHLSTGGYGGALLTPPEERDKARLLRWHGLDRLSRSDFRCEQDILDAGYRYHMTDDMAALGLVNFGTAMLNVLKARAHAKEFCAEFEAIPGIIMPRYDPHCDYWLHGMIVEGDRDAFMVKMQQMGIPTSRAHARNDKHSAYAKATIAQDGDLPGVTYFDEHQVNIPGGAWLTDFEIAQVEKSVHVSMAETSVPV